MSVSLCRFFTTLVIGIGLANAQKKFDRTSTRVISGLHVAIDCDTCSLKGDGLGSYIDGKDSVQSAAGLMFGLIAWQHTTELGNQPIPGRTAPQVRFLRFDLNQPVVASGAKPLGTIDDRLGRVLVAWKHDHSDDPEKNELIHCFADIDTVGQTVESTRVEVWVRVDGEQHVLQMGPWVMGEFSARAKIDGAGTSQARITRTSEKSWRIAAPKGSIGRLWNYSDIQHPINKGLYHFDFSMVVDMPAKAASVQHPARGTHTDIQSLTVEGGN